MRIRADFGVGHPAADVWALLSTGEGAGCVPGLVLDGPEGGSLGIDVEARHLVFDGTAAVASDARARTVTVEVKGAERGGRGRARSTLQLRVEENGLFSTINVEADLHLSGEIASEARLIAEQAYRLADQVAECLEARLGPGSPPSAPAPITPSAPTPEPAAVETTGPVGWLQRLFRRGDRTGE